MASFATTLANRTMDTNNNFDAQFDRMVGLLENGLLRKTPGVSFRKLSISLGVSPGSFNAYILDQVGISGAEVLDKYRDIY